MNMDILLVGTSDEVYLRSFFNWNKIFEKMKYLPAKTMFFVGPFYTPHPIYRNIGFWQSSFL